MIEGVLIVYLSSRLLSSIYFSFNMSLEIEDFTLVPSVSMLHLPHSSKAELSSLTSIEILGRVDTTAESLIASY